tara:strand:+ start:3614 stop:4447 length:834 start_codon:yes stop_codon:yes gene_type:complete
MKTKLLITAILISLATNAQEFYGKATYKTNSKTNIELDSSSMNADMQNQMKLHLAKMSQKTYILSFNKNESIYKEEVQLSPPSTGLGGGIEMVMVGGMASGSDIYYKNLKENRFVNKSEISGKHFLIKDNISKINWELTSETKNIGTYTCYKATYSTEVDRIEFTSRNEEEKESTIKETIVTTAWYTPQIAVSNGPRSFEGLPGLILEINDGNETIVCTEIILNPTKKIDISEPKKGKVVTQLEYEDIMQKKSREMMERYRSGRPGSENDVLIRVGG